MNFSLAKNMFQWFGAAVIGLLFQGCMKENQGVDAPYSVYKSNEPLEFRSDLCIARSPEVVTKLSECYISACINKVNGKKKDLFSNEVFTVKDLLFRSARFWDEEYEGCSFAAANVKMEYSPKGELIKVDGINTDIVSAYIAKSKYRQVNELKFKHILARVGRLSFGNLEWCDEFLLKLKYCSSGTYNISTGEWTNKTGEKTIELKAVPDNDLWIIPGKYKTKLSFKDKNGVWHKHFIEIDFKPGIITSFTAILKGDTVINKEWEYDSPDIEVNEIPIIPASGGETEKPIIKKVTQRRTRKFTLADGTVSYGEQYSETIDSYDVEYSLNGNSFSRDFTPLHIYSLVMTERPEKTVGKIYIKITSNGKSAKKTLNVKQEKNEFVPQKIEIPIFRYPTTDIEEEILKPILRYYIKGTWTSGAQDRVYKKLKAFYEVLSCTYPLDYDENDFPDGFIPYKYFDSSEGIFRLYSNYYNQINIRIKVSLSYNELKASKECSISQTGTYDTYYNKKEPKKEKNEHN